jgi:hypothetical protein
MTTLKWLTISMAALLVQLPFAAQAQAPAKTKSASAPVQATAKVNKVTAGEFLVEPPTLINLGFEWRIVGDDNRNAKVEVSFRKRGSTQWKPAIPLMRLQNERVYWSQGVDDHIINVQAPNMFAGSILDLEPGTTYEARFVMTDPDGVTGKATQIATVTTRPEPKPAAGGRVFHVYPPGWKGPKEPNSYTGFNCAYNYHCGGGDESFADRPRVVAGDTILVHAGVYSSLQDMYARVSSTRPVEGTYWLFGNGTAEKPIVIKAAGDGEVIFDGRGNFTLFNVQRANYNYFEGITFKNTEIAIQAGQQFVAGAIGLTVKNSRFENVNIGVNTSYSGSKNFYIADNVFLGRDDPKHLQGWNGDFWQQFDGVEGQKFPVKLSSYTAVRVYGSGHVVAYNYVSDFHDGIDVETYGNPDGSDAVKGPFYPPRADWDKRPIAIDFYNNYLTNFHDNAIEIDGSMHNVRVMRNMMINSASHPFTNQPSLSGPIYWIRNIAYNAPFGAARLTSGSAGVYFMNNTILTEFAASATNNLHLFNNLILGSNANPELLNITTYTNYNESDFNGFGAYPGQKNVVKWSSPQWGVAQHFDDLFDGITRRASGAAGAMPIREYSTLQAYSADTKLDKNSITVGYDIFENVKRLNAKDVKTVQNIYKAEDFDFRLKAGSAAVDKGMIIPQVTDGFTGAAPDLGALEVGQPAPHYGPRDQKR